MLPDGIYAFYSRACQPSWRLGLSFFYFSFCSFSSFLWLFGSQVIQAASDGLVNPDDLRIVFVQVGNDPSATRWLSNLDDRLDCQFDIVDVITTDQLGASGLPFAHWVARSVMTV